MSDDVTAVPDTEAERQALSWFREDPERIKSAAWGDAPAAGHAAAIVRAALARDVPAGRDLTAQDVSDALDVWDATDNAGTGDGPRVVADYLNRIARPAGDLPAPPDGPAHATVDGVELRHRTAGSLGIAGGVSDEYRAGPTPRDGATCAENPDCDGQCCKLAEPTPEIDWQRAYESVVGQAARAPHLVRLLRDCRDTLRLISLTESGHDLLRRCDAVLAVWDKEADERDGAIQAARGAS